MEADTIFERAGEPWSSDEDNKLNKLYNEDLLDIMEISKIHNRAPGGIISRLFKHQHIVNRTMARGYMKYKNSDLYKEIVSNNKEKNNNDTQDKPKKKVTQTDNIFISINKKDYTELKNDVKEMKTEIKELRKTLTELVEMMKAVYEFEDS
jgi:hypothetical protein